MQTWPRVLLSLVLGAAGEGSGAPVCGVSSPEIGRAFNSLYNFDFPATHTGLDCYIGTHPRDPLPHAVRAAAHLFYELDRLGILESEFLISDRRIAEKTKLRPDPLVREKLLAAIKEAETLSHEALAANPNNREALLAMTIILGVTTDYMALVEKHQILSLSPAKRSNRYAQRLLKTNSTCYDAYLTTGLTEYMVASLPFFIRWFVRFDQVQGSKDRAKQNLETVARQGTYLKPFAKIILALIHLRERQPGETQKLLVELTREYPFNPLFRKELARLDTEYRSTTGSH